MSLSNSAIAVPTSSKDRIHSLDVIRGVALNGILLMNILGFAYHMKAYSLPKYGGGLDDFNLFFFYMQDILFEGTMRGLFSLLFGVGAVLFVDRLQKKNLGMEGAFIYTRRMLWLLLFGLIHAFILLWWGEVLFFYAIAGFLLFPFLQYSNKVIFWVVVLLFVGSSLESIYGYNDYSVKKAHYEQFLEMSGVHPDSTVTDEVKDKIPVPIQEDFKAYKQMLKSTELDSEAFNKYVAYRTDSSYVALLREQSTFTSTFEAQVAYHGIPFDMLFMMLIGIILFRMGVVTGERKYSFYLIMMVVGYAVGLPVNIWEHNLKVSTDYSLMASYETSLTHDIGRIFMTMGHLGLILLFAKSGIIRPLQKGLASVGKMALTNYLLHSILCTIIFMGFGFGLFNKLERYEAYIVVVCIWIFEMIFSVIWLKYFRFGPFEWFWRKLTYGQIEGIRR